MLYVGRFAHLLGSHGKCWAQYFKDIEILQNIQCCCCLWGRKAPPRPACPWLAGSKPLLEKIASLHRVQGHSLRDSDRCSGSGQDQGLLMGQAVWKVHTLDLSTQWLTVASASDKDASWEQEGRDSVLFPVKSASPILTHLAVEGVREAALFPPISLLYCLEQAKGRKLEDTGHWGRKVLLAVSAQCDNGRWS